MDKKKVTKKVQTKSRYKGATRTRTSKAALHVIVDAATIAEMRERAKETGTKLSDVARRRLMLGRGCVAIPNDMWERAVSALSNAQHLDAGDFDGEAGKIFWQKCSQVCSDIRALRIGEVRL